MVLSVSGILRPSSAVTWINSIQQFSIAIGSGTTSNTAIINAVGANAFIVWGGQETSSTTFGPATGQCTLTNSTTVKATRGLSDTHTTTINGVVIDPTSSLVTSAQFVNIAVVSTTSNTATIASVDTTKSAVFYLGSSATTANYTSAVAKAVLTNATTVTGTFSASTNGTISAVVVTFAAGALNSAVQPFSAAFTANQATDTTTITSVNTSNSMIAYGGFTTAAGSAQTSSGFFSLASPTTVTYAFNTASTTSRTPTFTVIEFVSGVLSQVQRGSITLTSQSSNTATITSAPTAKSFVSYLGVKSNSGSYNLVETNITQTNATVLTANAVQTTATNTVGYEVLTFNQ